MTEGDAILTGILTALYFRNPNKLLKNPCIFFIWPTYDTKILGELRNYTRAVECRMLPILTAVRIAVRNDG